MIGSFIINQVGDENMPDALNRHLDDEEIESRCKEILDTWAKKDLIDIIIREMDRKQRIEFMKDNELNKED